MLFRMIKRGFEHERGGGFGVAHRAVALGHSQFVAANNRVEPVTVRVRIQRTRQAHGAEYVRGERFALSAKFVLDETVIEARVVRHKHRTFEHAAHVFAHIEKSRCIAHHCVSDARQCLNRGRNACAGIDERLPTLNTAIAMKPNNRNLSHAVMQRAAAGRFNVDERELAKLQNRCGKREQISHFFSRELGLRQQRHDEREAR